jgi:trehalose 6-phosphate synthase
LSHSNKALCPKKSRAGHGSYAPLFRAASSCWAWDRLDYSKGIPERLRAFRDALERYEELRGRIVLIQVVVPSREEIPKYHEFKERIDRLVGDINGRFSTDTWLPVHYRFRSLDQDDLLAHYRACDIALVTPLKDGMNLVAKEYCACCVGRNDGALILSQFAGGASNSNPARYW